MDRRCLLESPGAWIAPTAQQLRNAHVALRDTHATAESYLWTFEFSVARRRPIGVPTDDDYNLLRAMLVSACAGLDSMVKHAIRDALPAVIDRVDAAQDKLLRFVEHSRPDPDTPTAPLATGLTASDTRAALIDELTRELTQRSLRSRERILSAASYFDLRPEDLVVDIEVLDDALRARNQLAHEAGIGAMQPPRDDTRPPKQRFVDYTEAVLACAGSFLVGVDAKLSKHQPKADSAARLRDLGAKDEACATLLNMRNQEHKTQ